eukprot:tig00001574_g9355.t1
MLAAAALAAGRSARPNATVVALGIAGPAAALLIIRQKSTTVPAKKLGTEKLNAFQRRVLKRWPIAPKQEDMPDMWDPETGEKVEWMGLGVKTRERKEEDKEYVRRETFDQKDGWTVSWRRTGVIAKKCGMMPLWDSWGVRHALTVLQLEAVKVLQVKTAAKEGYYALQVGTGDMKPKHVTKPMLFHFARAGVEPKRHICEFRVTPDAVVPVGTEITARHFLPGQYIDVQGTSVGKGFQGAMKRHHFAGQGASHGNSLSHRVLGSTGNRQDPGRVFKGKKMAGHLGAATRTIQNLQIFKVDAARNLLFVKGNVPGHAGSYARVKDAIKKKFAELPPFPTFVPDAAEAPEAAAAELTMGPGRDPFKLKYPDFVDSATLSEGKKEKKKPGQKKKEE